MNNLPLGCPPPLPLLPSSLAQPHCLLWRPKTPPFRLHLSQVYACHVELCFLSWFRAKKLSSHEQYRITWFLSWSPCLSCAEQVVAFLKENRNVRLSIFAARLYYFWNPDYQHGLRILRHQRAWVRIMSFRGESRGGWGLEGGAVGGMGADLEDPPGRVSGRRTWETRQD